jgi:hypothetical protein
MGLFGNLGDMGNMVNQARELQKNLAKIKDELKHLTYEGEAGGVKVTVDGEMEIKKIDYDVNRIVPNQLGGLIKEAANRALNQAKEDAAQKLKQAAGGLSLPGLT